MFLFTRKQLEIFINKISKKWRRNVQKSREYTDEVRDGGLRSTCYVMNVRSTERTKQDESGIYYKSSYVILEPYELCSKNNIGAILNVKIALQITNLYKFQYGVYKKVRTRSVGSDGSQEDRFFKAIVFWENC